MDIEHDLLVALLFDPMSNQEMAKVFGHKLSLVRRTTSKLCVQGFIRVKTYHYPLYAKPFYTYTLTRLGKDRAKEIVK